MVQHVDVAHRWRLGGGMGGRLPDRIGDLDTDGQRIGPAGANQALAPDHGEVR